MRIRWASRLLDRLVWRLYRWRYPAQPPRPEIGAVLLYAGPNGEQMEMQVQVSSDPLPVVVNVPEPVPQWTLQLAVAPMVQEQPSFTARKFFASHVVYYPEGPISK